MEKLDRESALDAIDELVDRQLALVIKLGRTDSTLAEEAHQCNMAWRELVLKVGGISQGEFDIYRSNKKDIEK